MKKYFIPFLLALTLILTAGLCGCGDKSNNGNEDETKVEHTFDANGVCTDCGYIDMSGLTEKAAIEKYGFYIEDTDGNSTYSAGDMVSFGSYPQNRVTDEQTVAALNGAAGDLPDEQNAGEWTSYGYYSESVKKDYSFYIDVENGGKTYRGVYMTAFRPYYSGLPAGEDYSYIDDSGFNLNTVYWFEYAPLKWRVLKYDNGNLMLASNYSVEAQPFQDLYEMTEEDIFHPETENAVNEWETSSVRAFLNDDFYNLAFGETEKDMIVKVTLDNKTTGYSDTAKYQINQNNTQDNVYLLSYADVSTREYGYTAVASSRQRSLTDYALSQGLRPSGQSSTASGEAACYYMLRSAGGFSYVICGVTKTGGLGGTQTALIIDEDTSVNGGLTETIDGLAINGNLGVLPAVTVKVWNK